VADDLKPPASSAVEAHAAPASTLTGLLTSPGRRAPDGRTHRFRFGVAYLVLAGVVGAAVGTFILLLGRPEKANVEWSTWKPEAKGGFRIQEIADHVGRRYRLGDGRQLLVAIPGAPSIADGENRIPVSGVARRAPIVRSRSDFSFTSLNDGLMYVLCGGSSPRCSLAGRATDERGRLVRREALELALYTFRYVDGIESILTFMPPAAGSEDTHALFLQKSDLAAQLSRPLTHTLRAKATLQPGGMDPIEGIVVDRLTLPRLFRTQPSQAQDGSVILVLDPAALNT
jgi:hypothetical protein